MLIYTSDSGCEKWKHTGECIALGPRQPSNDQDCDVQIQDRWSGFCDCTNGYMNIRNCEEPVEYPTCHEACYARGKTYTTVK